MKTNKNIFYVKGENSKTKSAASFKNGWMLNPDNVRLKIYCKHALTSNFKFTEILSLGTEINYSEPKQLK